MEACVKPSWFLLLLGFSALAVTVQETGNCPSPDEVSCTAGVKCNSNEDCDKDMLCCANSCYTKLCVSIGEIGASESDGPSESECRPYIEKALRELTETGEAKVVGDDEEGDGVSTEDVPTIEITTDDSIERDGTDEIAQAQTQSAESAETDRDEEPSAEQETAPDEKSEEAAEAAQTTEDDENEKSVEDDATQGESPSKEESKEEEEVADQSQEKASVEEQESPSAEEETETNEPEIIEAIEEIAEKIEILEAQQASTEQAAVSAEEAERSREEEGAEESAEAPGESQEDSTKEESVEVAASAEIEEAQSEEKGGATSAEEAAAKSTESAEDSGCPPVEQVSCREGVKCDADKDCKRNHLCCPNKCYGKRCVRTEGTEGEEEESEEAQSEEHVQEAQESGEAVGCPSPAKVSCTEGTLCSRHAHCKDTEICCPNKCYRSRCVEGQLPEGEERGQPSVEEESKEEEEEQVKGKSQSGASSGCPAPREVPCRQGEKCNRHAHCKEDEICCPNDCYGLRCVKGELGPGEERGEESEEESEEKVEAPQAKPSERASSGCPSRDQVPCREGDKCNKHAHCKSSEICCPNNCYGWRCVEGELGEGEERGESEEDQSAEEEQAKSRESGEKTGCPNLNEIPCGQKGNICAKHADCEDSEICCPNKCYRRLCIEGELAEGEERGERSAEVSREEVKAASVESAEKTGCPVANEVPCAGGVACAKHRECGQGEICCPNKCYRKRCVVGELASGEEDEESEEEESKEEQKEEPPKEVKIVKKVREEVIVKMEKKPEPKKIVREVLREVKIVEKKESEDSVEREEADKVEELSSDIEAPTELRSRNHVEQLLKLDEQSSETEEIVNGVADITLKELKKLYENAIKPLEVLYKYRDLSNRHFGDPEIFSKPLVLFMGPWSGGKSSIINYLVNNEYNETSLRTGAEPSPAYFNILMHGDEPEVIDGTELAADFTFSGLQKFGQGLEERLRGVKLPTKLLEKVNIVEIPGILEVRKQVSRLFPFNDACQWFIDRADIIFLVYDPSKLDVGPETEAILDQLKGREHQTRIILNKADQVKPEELMRVQGALIWNISPLMSSPQPPVMYTTSLWSRPYESWAPVRLLQAQERAFLRDLRSAVDKRIENKIASARRFAVRVRNHAKMVDCYLTTYYNHKSVFGNRKQIADQIIEHPQDYHIYEGLSTLTNISRYDLPDPEVYRDFFKLNPLYDFQQLSATCTYFRGCPINRLDIAIAYDLPELVGTHKKLVEEALANKDKVKEEKSKPKKKQKSAPGS